MEDNEGQEQRVTPLNEIDLTFLTTDPSWGKTQVPKEYLKQLIQDKEVVLAQIDENGKISLMIDENTQKPITISDFEKTWARLGYLTKDLRLGNIGRMSGDKHVIEYYLDLSGDFLEGGFPKAHITALQRSAVKLEVSQSIGGFFRKRQGTITSENISNDIEPSKNRSLFGGKRED